MTIQGYFDGTAVRTLEPVDLKVNQRVYINIPEGKTKMTGAELRDLFDGMKAVHREAEEVRKQEQKAAIDNLFNLLTEEEAAAFGKEMEQPLRFKTVDA